MAAQQKLEAELAARVTRLTHLTADVTGATSLSAYTSLTLQARLSTEAASINTLVAKVPTDTTFAELDADRAAMYKDNRVYAVMSPQVFKMIEASLVVEQLTTMQGNEATLQTEVASLVGDGRLSDCPESLQQLRGAHLELVNSDREYSGQRSWLRCRQTGPVTRTSS